MPLIDNKQIGLSGSTLPLILNHNEEGIIRFSENQKEIILNIHKLHNVTAIVNPIVTFKMDITSVNLSNKNKHDFLLNNVFRVNGQQVITQEYDNGFVKPEINIKRGSYYAPLVMLTETFEQSIQLSYSEDINAIFTLSFDKFDFVGYEPFTMQFYITIRSADADVSIDDNLIVKYTAYIESDNINQYKFYNKHANIIDSNMESFMLLRTNPKLTGNVKLVVDNNYNLYLDTFKTSKTSVLNKKQYRKVKISDDGNYPYDIYRTFKSLPKGELYSVYQDSYDPHKNYFDLNLQIENIYEYGAEYNADSLYTENMKILAPLYIGKNLPDYFIIFKTDRLISTNINDSNINIYKELINDAKCVKIFDLRNATSIGKYLNNYKSMIAKYLAGSCYLQFIEQDNEKNSDNYRQGRNTWKGIVVDKGILSEKTETSYFATKILNDEQAIQENYNLFLLNGFYRNNLLFPNIINLEYMFNDDESADFSMHNYFGLYVTENQFLTFNQVIQTDNSSEIDYSYYDTSNNLVDLTSTCVNVIDDEKYSDRLFLASTTNDAMYISQVNDVYSFVKNSVVNKPNENVVQIASTPFNIDESVKSIMSLDFTKQLQVGEHIKFISISETTTAKADQNIVLEIIASSDARLKKTVNNINPYVLTNIPTKADNDIATSIYRLNFYALDLNDDTKLASLSDQIIRIAACINKFNSFIKVTSFDEETLAVTSEYTNTYVQHILQMYAKNTVDDIRYLNYNNEVNCYTIQSNYNLYNNAALPFINNGLELTGDRLTSTCKFLDVTTLQGQYIYEINKDIYEELKDIYSPLIATVNGYYPLTKLPAVITEINDKTVNEGKEYTYNIDLKNVVSPFDVKKCLIASKYEATYVNNMINICSPMSFNISLLGINNIKDIDMTMNNNSTLEYQTSIYTQFKAGEKIYLNNSDPRLRNFITYKLISGRINNIPLSSNSVFCITSNNIYYLRSGKSIRSLAKYTLKTKYIEFVEDTVIALDNFKQLDLYSYQTNTPLLDETNYYTDPNHMESSNLNIPIVPAVNCQWKSNGVYFDNNSTLDVNNLINPYTIVGNFKENVYTPAGNDNNQYIINRIDNIINYKNTQMSIHDLIINKRYKNSIKKYLMSNFKLDTAIGYYNAHVQTLEFIYYGIKFILKLASVQYKNEIKLNEYDNYEIFILNDYTASTTNDIYISTEEEFILIINHNFKSNEYHASNSIKNITNGIVDAQYNWYQAPFNYQLVNSSFFNNMYFINKSNPYVINKNSDISYIVELDLPIYDKDYVNFNENPRYAYIKNSYINSNQTYDILERRTTTLQVNNVATKYYYYNIISQKNATTFDINAENNYINAFNKTTVDNRQKNTYILKNTVDNSNQILNYKDKLVKYINSYNYSNINLYIISDSLTTISINDSYRPLTLSLSIPNKIKYNQGLFNPKFNDVFMFDIQDPISDDIDMDTLSANTKVVSINSLANYYYNKIVDNGCTCVYNYFMTKYRSPFLTDWDAIYRLYKDDTNYTLLNGYISGITDKMFFGSKCLNITNDSIVLQKWNHNKDNNNYTISLAKYNETTKPTTSYKIRLNLTKTFYNHIISCTSLSTNWNVISDVLNIESYITNYINNTLIKLYDFRNNFDLTLYKKYSAKHLEPHQIFVKEQPEDFNEYEIDTNYTTEFTELNNELILTLTINTYGNYYLYPIMKINKI